MKANTFSAIEMLFERHYVRLCEFVYRMVNCRETARDLVQDVFVSLMESGLPKELAANAVKSYLYGMVKHAALNYIRREQIADRVCEQQLLQTVEEARILQEMVHAEILGELYAALEALPQGCAQVCKMAYFGGKKNQEIADALGVSINTIKTQKQRAIALLRNKLSPQAIAVLLVYLTR